MASLVGSHSNVGSETLVSFRLVENSPPFFEIDNVHQESQGRVQLAVVSLGSTPNNQIEPRSQRVPVLDNRPDQADTITPIRATNAVYQEGG